MESFLAVLSTLDAVNNTLASVIVDVVNSDSPRSVHILCSECLNDLAVQQIQVPKIIIHPNITKVTADDMVVVVCSTDQEAQSIMKHISVDAPAKFLVLWFKGHDFTTVFKTCWSRNIIRVVAAVIVKETVPLYTFVPFKDTNCLDMNPVLVGKWPGSTINIFPSGKINDVQGCLINATAVHYPPYLILRERMPNLTEEMSGLWAPILKSMAVKLNATLYLIPRPNKEWPDTHNVTDAFFFSKFASTSQRARIFDMPATARADCYSFCVPRLEKNLSFWKKLLKPFQCQVWWAVSVSFIAILFTTYVLLSGTEPLGRVTLNLIAKLAGCSACQIRTAGLRDMMVAIIWSISCMVFMTLYQAKEQSFRSSLDRLNWIQSVEDLVEYDLSVRGDRILVDAARDSYPMLNLEPFESEYGMFQEPVNAVAGYIADSEECSVLNERRGFRRDGRHPMALLEGCVFIVHERLFLLPRHSPLTKRIEDVHMKLTESGILHHLMDKDPKPEAVSIPLHKLSMTDMKPGFTLLMSGLVTALSIFMGEVVWMRIKHLLPEFTLQNKNLGMTSKCLQVSEISTESKK